MYSMIALKRIHAMAPRTPRLGELYTDHLLTGFSVTTTLQQWIPAFSRALHHLEGCKHFSDFYHFILRPF
jgi:hypothetical protein